MRALLFVLLLPVLLPAQTFVTMVNNGASTNRIDVVTVGDGYTTAELNRYEQHVQVYLDHMFSEQPFTRYQKFFNVHRVDVISNESGADDPGATPPVVKDTALNSTYLCNGITHRHLCLDAGLADAAANSAVAGFGIDIDMKVAAINDTQYGGSGGRWASFAGANAAASELALHEIAHSFADLGDEYEYGGGTGTYVGPEPTEANVTKGNSKWNRWVGYVDSSTGAVGYFEGGRYYAQGIYRPSQNSKMRNLYQKFDPISREQFISEIYNYVDPLDGWDSNVSTLVDPSSVSVTTIDPKVISVEWFLNGTSIGVLGESVNISSLVSHGTLGVGQLTTLTAMAYDSILNDSNTGGELDWWRLTDDSKLRQTVDWTIQITPEPDAALLLLLGLIGFARKRAEVPLLDH